MFGPTLTPFGAVTVRVAAAGRENQIVVEGKWRGRFPQLDVAVPGFRPQQRTAAGEREVFTLIPAS